MINIILGLLGLGIIVFIHELGHFIAARFFGVAVETFSIGMGPVLVRKKWGETEYRISLVPIGGYCGMKGEKGFQEAIEKNLLEIPKDPQSFYGVHPLKRAMIAFSGPFFNILFAVLAFTIIGLIGFSFFTTPNKIILVSDINPEMQSAAAQAGLQTGDYITEINNNPIRNFNDLFSQIAVQAQQEIAVKVRRNNEDFSYTLIPELDTTTGAGKIGVFSWVDPVIDSVKPSTPAFFANLQKGDIIIAVDEKPIMHTIDFFRALEQKNSTSLTVKRANEQITTELIIPFVDDEKMDIGIVFSAIEEYSPKYSFFPAIAHGFSETFSLFTLTLKSLTLLFKGIDLTQAISGPVRITLMIGEVAQSGFSKGISAGFVSVLNFLALISVSLFIMNLLPIPILDGGIILFAALEFLRKKPVPPKILYKIQFIGIGFIAILFAFALFSDARYILGSIFKK